MTNEFNNTMDMINNRLDDELCDKLSNSAYLTELTSVDHYSNSEDMLYSIASDFENESDNSFDYLSFASFEDTINTLNDFINLDSIGLDEPIFILEHDGEILDADTDYFNIITNLGFEDSLNKDGKQVLKEYEDIKDLLNQFEHDKEQNTLDMIRDYDYNWTTIDDLAGLLEKYVEE